MKELILNKNKQIQYDLPECEITDKKYYGILNSIGYKGFILKESFDSSEFKILCINEITRGNSFGIQGKFSFVSLKETIKQAILSNCSVYEFETPQELFAWLAKE